MATIDLKTLPKWKELMYGNHTLQIVARAPEHSDSDKSEGATFTTRRMTISDSVSPRATRLTLDIYDGETLKNHIVYAITPGSYFMMPSLSDIQGTVKFIGWLDDGTFNASDLSAITYGDGINPLSDRYGAVWQSATYASKDDVPLSMVIDETAKAFATVKFNFASVPEGTAIIMANVSGWYPNIYDAVIMRPVDASTGVRTTTNDLTSLTTTMFVPKSETTQAGFGYDFLAFDSGSNALGATEQIKVESVSTETVTEVQATFVAKLATPQNVTANGTTVSWDAVENATSYAVLADGSEIGTVEGAVTDLTGTTWVFNDTVNLITQMVWIDFIDLNKKQFNGISPGGATMYYGFLDDKGEQDGLMAYGASGWLNPAYKAITITGGTDATNSALISWLESNATQQTVSPKVGVDLTTLPGWPPLSGGTHNIAIVAKADGYIDSEKSAGVEVTKGASPKTLEESAWAEIAQVSADKSWNAMGWKVGDSKTITLNGTVGTLALDNYQCKVYILGFDHNAEKEGQGISFGMLEGVDGKQLCLVDQYYNTSTSEVMAFKMNETNTNAGGWKAAKMRKTILGSTDVENGDATPDAIANPGANTLMAALPADLRTVLKPITKYTNNVGKSSDASAVSPSIDYLPLMAELEVFGVQTNANPNEKTYQAQYEYYKSGNSKIKYEQNNVDSAANWWLRSPNSGGFGNGCCMVDIDGMDYIMMPHKSYGVAPVFLV